MNTLRKCFKLTCVIATFAMTIRWISVYSEDADAVQPIEHKGFQFPADQLPMLSICHGRPIIESKLKEYNDSLTYAKFIKLWSEGSYNDINKINFDDISLNSSEFYVSDMTKFRNGTTVVGRSPNFLHEQPRVTYIGFRGQNVL